MLFKMIEALSNTFGPSGFEDEVVKVVKNLSFLFKVETDLMNTVYVHLKSITGNRL